MIILAESPSSESEREYTVNGEIIIGLNYCIFRKIRGIYSQKIAVIAIQHNVISESTDTHTKLGLTSF